MGFSSRGRKPGLRAVVPARGRQDGGKERFGARARRSANQKNGQITENGQTLEVGVRRRIVWEESFTRLSSRVAIGRAG